MEARAIKRPFDDRIVAQLRRSLYGASDGLRDVPEMLKSVIEHGLWQERVVEETGEVVTFERFEDFVTTPPLEGLGSTVRQLKHLCRDDKPALDAIDRATQREAHRPVSNNNVITSSAEKTVQGNSETYALRKLRKDRPDLHERVLEDEISPHAAMIEAGFRQRTITVPSDVRKAARTLSRHFDPDELYQAMKGAQR